MALTYSRSLLEERSEDHCIMLLASPPQAPALMTRPLRTSSLCFLLSHKQAPGFLHLPHICQNMVALPVSPPHSNFKRQSLCQMQIQDSHHHVLFLAHESLLLVASSSIHSPHSSDPQPSSWTNIY